MRYIRKGFLPDKNEINILKNVNTMLNFVVLCLFYEFEVGEGRFSNFKFDSLRNIEKVIEVPIYDTL